MKNLFFLLLLSIFLLGSTNLIGQEMDEALPPDFLSTIETIEQDIATEQEPLSTATSYQQSATSLDQLTQELHMKKINNLHIEVMAICILCFLALAVNSFLLIKKEQFSPQDLINANGLVLIIFGTILVIMLSESEQQLTAAVGILGAVAGYLFGTMKKEPKEATQPTAPPPPQS